MSIVVVGLLLTGTTVGTSLQEVQANYFNGCSAGDRPYFAGTGDTLDNIATRYGTNGSILARYNHITNVNSIFNHQVICIPHAGDISIAQSTQPTRDIPVYFPKRTGHGPAANASSGSGSVVNTTRSPVVPTRSSSVANTGSDLVKKTSHAPVGHVNVFPYGVCTWWADQRYYQLHGFFVPWRTQANAWQWVARAYQFGWHVSKSPAVGDIMVLQPGVQGASPLGHVAVVERVLNNGRVVASSMNWGSRPWAVTTWQFSPGPGVMFVTR
ncbi:MAG TPA: CHAP domain-containing protein [Ktedonobacteraceae bacterium]|nr:CHAP domain-containing protein [Ktedonobacteraceae bacterium]